MAIVRKRRYAVPPGSELSKVGQIWIIESLAERHTGIVMRDHLRDLFIPWDNPPQVTYRDVASSSELFAALEDLCSDVKRTRRWPILDIECHGLADLSGLALRDGSTASWEELKPRLQKINLTSRFNLFLILALCNGGYFGSAERLHEPAAFVAYLGPNTEIGDVELSNALKAFFSALFEKRDATEAINALNAAVPGFPYFYATAEGIFRLALEGYLKDVSERGRRNRARDMVFRLRDAGNRQVPSINEMMRWYEKREREMFADFRRVYFALDAFPENAERFPVDYWQIWRAAQRKR